MADKPKRRRPKPTQLSKFVNSKKRKAKRPSRRDLRSIYKLILNSLPEARVSCLMQALHWYDNAVDYYRAYDKKNEKLKLLKAARALDAADEYRQQSFKALKESDKEPLLIKSIEKIEEALTGLLRTKSIKSVYAKLRRIRSKLDKREARLTEKYSRVISFLQEALKPKNSNGNTVLLKVGELPKDRHVTSDYRTMLYSRQHTQRMMQQFKSEGLLALVINEIVWLSRVASYVKSDKNNLGYIPDLQREKDATNIMWNNLVSYCRANSQFAKRLVRTPRKRRTKRK